jgi:hypothetical protein
VRRNEKYNVRRAAFLQARKLQKSFSLVFIECVGLGIETVIRFHLSTAKFKTNVAWKEK